MDVVILFHSTNHSIWAEEELNKSGIKCKMIPMPRHLSSDCGYCVKIKKAKKDTAEKILKANNIDYEGIEEI